MEGEQWVALAEVGDLDGRPKVVKVEGHQIALFRVEDRFYAVDNRCPHMGYPLSQGALRDTTLTCDWHNWKFSLEDGACLRGEEDVRSYPVRVEAGRILANLAGPPVEDLMARHLESLRKGLFKHESGRIARDAARLLTLGMRPAEVMHEGARHSADREEYGWGHALAVIADCLSLAEFYAADEVAIPVVRALTAASEPVRRYPVRETAAPERADPAAEAEFRRRIEDEDVDGAEALFRGALEAGMHPREAQRWLLNAASDHFLGFGHQMIYVYKAAQFAELAGWDRAHDVLPSLVPSIVWATRYDRLPEMRKYIGQVRDIEPQLPGLAEKLRAPQGAYDFSRFREDVLFGKGPAAFEAVHSALQTGVHVDLIAQALVRAASERILRMDIEWELSHDEKVWDEGGWLEVTHLLTHANATRQLLRRGVTPEALRSLYHSAWFINYQRRFDRQDGVRADQEPLPQPVSTTPEELAAEYRAAIQGKQIERALGVADRWRTLELGPDPLLEALGREGTEVDDGLFIMVAHVLKTSRAAIEEFRTSTDGAGAWLPLMAATRYVASPRRMNPVYDLALNGVRFARSGAGL